MKIRRDMKGSVGGEYQVAFHSKPRHFFPLSNGLVFELGVDHIRHEKIQIRLYFLTLALVVYPIQSFITNTFVGSASVLAFLRLILTLKSELQALVNILKNKKNQLM